MKYTTLGRSGLAVSTLTLGTMTFGSETEAEEAHAQLDQYTAAGGTMLETADVYSGGHAEEIVGEWLRGQSNAARDRLVIAGKGRFPVGVDARDSGTSRRHLRRALEGTLGRLGVDHLDLYQVHSWDPVTPLDETLGFLDSAVQSGKISYAGLSNFLGWQIAQAASNVRGRFPLISMQPQYNLLAREVEWEILPACEANGLGVLPWSPLGGGWLAGKYSQESRPSGATRLGEDPERGVEAYDLRSGEPRTWRVLEALQGIAEAHGQSMSRIALAWLSAQPAVSSVILGARTTRQLADNLGSVEVMLSAEDLATLDRASDPEPSAWPYGAAGREQRSRALA
ncbi:aldo/keto reductase [Cryobacterium arcticum]|uniref:MocA family oxidoreductase n=1 Tax=Cryobacterium arcticum TaxID=670052 RepID=A0A1B1BLR9_9MICO|nr:aldo/keto reductase [Cryobacterium arcticum]ANP73570.1 MocA family oxidoreductase [Cryobacterium arcticum]